MIRFLLAALFVSAFAVIAGPSAHACSAPDTLCVTNFSISPSVIAGDGSQPATGTVATNVPQGPVMISVGSNLGYTCLPPATYAPPTGGFSGGCSAPGTSLSFSMKGTNYTASPQIVNIQVALAYGNTMLQQPVTVNPAADPREPVPQDPDMTCPDCNNGGLPINFSNGNTWITHQDYSIPGLGGGLTLSRTWNSLWSLAQPPETSGIFGDSWRSTFEERIQTLTGGAVKYWKADGSSLFFSFNVGTGSYYMTAPANDQTSLNFDSGTTLWTVTFKDGGKKIFNNA